MTKQTSVTLLCLLALLVPSPARAEEDQGPPRIYTLTIDGNEFEIEGGRSSKVQVDGRDTTVQLEVKPYRTFEKYGVSFLFPEDFVYSVDDEDESVTIWSLDGADISLMVQRFNLEIEPEQLLDVLVPNIKEQYAQLDVVEESAQLEGHQQTFEGIKLIVQLGDVELVQDIYAFKNDEGVFSVIVQDSREEPGKPTAEYN